MAREYREVIAGEQDSGRRLDRILRILLPGWGLSEIYGAIRKGDIRVNGLRTEQSARIAAGDRIRLPSGARSPAPPSPAILPAAGCGDPDIILENADLLIVNKAAGVLSHGAGGLDEWIISNRSEALRGSLAFRPAPLHRLDRNTSGVLCFSLSITGAREGSRAFREGLTRKVYAAVLRGELKGRQVWEDSLERDGESGRSMVSEGGRRARSLCIPLERGKGISLAAIVLGTGRTHQIRVQAASRGHALAGDLKYGGGDFPGGYLLHAWGIGFGPGLPGTFPSRAVAPFPPAWREALSARFGPGAEERAAEALSGILDGEGLSRP